jgi:hypothetical protein
VLFNYLANLIKLKKNFLRDWGGGNEERGYSYMKSLIKGYGREKRLGYTALWNNSEAQFHVLLFGIMSTFIYWCHTKPRYYTTIITISSVTFQNTIQFSFLHKKKFCLFKYLFSVHWARQLKQQHSWCLFRTWQVQILVEIMLIPIEVFSYFPQSRQQNAWKVLHIRSWLIPSTSYAITQYYSTLHSLS